MGPFPFFGLILLPVQVQDTAGRGVTFDGRFPLEISAEVADDADGSALMEALDWVRLHPYDLNRITLEELLSIPCVTLWGALAVVAFRRDGHAFRSPEELTVIGDDGAALYGALAPYTCVPPKSSPASRTGGVQFRTRAISGVPGDNSAQGSPLRMSSRLVYAGHAGTEGGALFAKGAGERMADAFVSCYALLRNVGPVTEFLAGDFEIESGEGLVFCRGPTAVRSIWSVRPRDGLAIVPHRSTDESRYLRGVAVAFTAGECWRGAFFLSDRSYGASVDTAGEATSFFRGEYSTAGSILKKDALRERLVGIHARYVLCGRYSAGCTLYRAYFNRSFAPVDRMRLTGNGVDAGGVDASGKFGALSLAGECAFVGRGARGLSMSMTFVPAGTHLVMIRWRDYQPGFDNPHASGECENGETRNERGIAASLRLVPARGVRATIHCDAFEHPWPDPRRLTPVRGTELAISAETPVARGSGLSVRLSRKLTHDLAKYADTLGRDDRGAVETRDDRLRCELASDAGDILRCSTVIELSRISGTGVGRLDGFLLGEDIRLTPLPGLSFDARIASFRTDGYGARLYEFESTLPGMLSILPLYGRGFRWYVQIRWNPTACLEFAARYSATTGEASVTGSPPFYDVAGSTAAQAALQVDMRFP